jgi:putative salt-induced outer membrane protein
MENAMLKSHAGRAALALLLAAPAYAQAPAEPKKPPYEFVADFGLAASQGNQEITTVNAGQKYSYAFERWKFAQDFSAVRGNNGGALIAEQYSLGLRGDYNITPKLAFFVKTTGFRNRLAGLNGLFNEAVGLAWKPVGTDIDKLEFAAGLGALQRQFIGTATTPNSSDLVGSLDGLYRHHFSKVAFFEQTAGFVPNFTTGDAWLARAQSSVVAPISQRFGLKVGYLININNAPPVVGGRELKKFDGLLTAGVQFTY